MTDLRAAVLAIPTPTRFENDANGNWFTTDMEYGWDCGVEAVLALIPEGAVLVTAHALAVKLRAWEEHRHPSPSPEDDDGPVNGWEAWDAEAAAILHHLRETP